MYSSFDAISKIDDIDTIIDDDGSIITDDIEVYKNIRNIVFKEERYKYDLSILNMIKIDGLSPSSSKIFRYFLKNKDISYDEIKKKINKDDLFKIFDINHRDNFLLLSCYDLIGTNGSIDIKKTNDKEEKVEIYDSYRFNSKCLIDVDNITLEFPKILLIDGYIENISNIHHILQLSSEKKIPMLIFCRGYSNDVINTLSVNFHRKTLQVLPFELKIDEKSVNDIFDLGLISNSEVISSEKGQYFSNIKYENIPCVESIKYHKNDSSIFIKNESSKNHVLNHISKIKERILTCDEFNFDINIRRIKNLTSKYIILNIKNNLDFEIRSKKIRHNIRMLDHISRYGYMKIKNEYFPISSYDIAKKTYEEFIEKIKNDNIVKI